MLQALKVTFVISLLAGLTWWVVTARPQPNPTGASKQPLVTQIRQNSLKSEVPISSNLADNDINNSIVTLTFTPAYTIYLPIIFGCSPLYFDDYSDPTSGWSIADYTYSLYEYLNGEYRILRKAGGWSGARPWPGGSPGFKGGSYIVAADVRNATGVYGSYGLLFGMSDNWTQFYTFEIFPNGIYEIWRGGYGTTWIKLASGSSSSINTDTASNRLKIERNGSLIKAYVNGQLLTSISDSAYTGLTQVGLIVSSYGQPNVDARFDDFTVYPISCGAAATVLNQTSGTSDIGGATRDTELLGGWMSGPSR